MFGIGMPEMILILIVALIVVGPKRLPDLAKALGRAVGEFRKATSELKESLGVDEELREVKKAFDGINSDLRDSMRAAVSSATADDGAKPHESSPSNTVPSTNLTDLKKSFNALNNPSNNPADAVLDSTSAPKSSRDHEATGKDSMDDAQRGR